ncbi:MAG: tetratricopeptide repeat-containing protein, partial [Rhizobacter sp.]|nr:tetratricopeptide repeat-containing protein [Rhizobacter sp.]
MTLRDSLGNTVTLQDAASLAAVNAFVEGFIACETRVVDILAAAEHDHSTLVQSYAGMLQMFSETPAAPVNAKPYFDRAQASAPQATERERRFLGCLQAWAAGDITRAMALHEAQVKDHPRDLVSLKLGHYHCFNRGDSPGMLRLALAALPHAADVPYLHGMAAFAYEQCHLLDEAEAAASLAIRMRRKEPWAHHAMAHVMLTEGRIEEGLAFTLGVSDTWIGLNSFMETHNWWHVALFQLERREHDAALRTYDEHVWGVCKDYTQDQIGAVSLLARLELAGVDVGSRWNDVADYLEARTDDHVLPFLDMQYLYGLARAGRPQADGLMASVERWAAQAPPQSSAAWQRVCVPACRGLLAAARGDFRTAIDQL